MTKNKIIEFIKQRDFELVKELGNGAFGRTVLLQDNDINHKFVCKKYAPIKGIDKEEYYKNFINEIKLLHLLYHRNIVRVFNYYLYPENQTGYIVMEYIEGNDILSYLKKFPENINTVFEQIINGFQYLEENNILHRDIRSTNIMIDKNSIVKIIDFGFGKEIKFDDDKNKSISINWIGNERPSEFSDKIYDHKTEIFFLGKLFEDLIRHIDSSFKYKHTLKQMILADYNQRISSFSEIKKLILQSNNGVNLFNEEERNIYKEFADLISNSLSERKDSASLIMDIDFVINNLDELNKRTILEDYVDSKHLLQSFITGSYSYRHISCFTSTIKNFTKFFISLSKEKQNLVLYNLETRFLDVKEAYEITDDDIPF